jgi:hypothetical protein
MDSTTTIRRRDRLKHHYTMTSNVLIFGYKQLTDAEKLTYQAIDSFDWSDEAGKRKGYAFPSLATMARLRRLDERTLRRHLASLEAVGLLRRESRPGQPNLLWIEEPSKEECEAYLCTFAMSPDTDVRGRGDTDIRPLYESEELETDKTVNGANANKVRRKDTQLPSAGEKAKSEYLAGEILSVMGDQQSLGMYRRAAQTLPPHMVFEAISEVRQADREHRIRTRRGAYFTWLVQRQIGKPRE